MPIRTPGPARPSLALGTMNFGKRTPADDSERIVRRALERGIRVFDTANAYNAGEAERILGRALGKRPGPRRGRHQGRLRAHRAASQRGSRPRRCERASLRGSLERLGLAYRVDVYYLHVPDHATPIEPDARRDETGSSSTQAARAHWGVSNYAAWQILEIDRARCGSLPGSPRRVAGPLQRAAPSARHRVLRLRAAMSDSHDGLQSAGGRPAGRQAAHGGGTEPGVALRRQRALPAPLLHARHVRARGTVAGRRGERGDDDGRARVRVGGGAGGSRLRPRRPRFGEATGRRGGGRGPHAIQRGPSRASKSSRASGTAPTRATFDDGGG
jgi:hypothetical protein